MGLETVVKDITDAAQKEAAQVSEAATKDIESILNDAEKQSLKIKGDAVADAEERVTKMEVQELASAKLEIKRMQLNARKEVLDTTFAQALGAISSLDEAKNKELLKELISKYGSNGTKIYSNKRDETVVKQLADLEYVGNIDCIGGIVIENDDGTVKLDYTFDSICDGVFESALKQTSDLLFG
ncbi:MAG: V-type ATP synthase subunit E [Methanosarcinales archaeon]|nr:V-type ATP synthase subunit E [Methanosarcinales archaeon]